MKIVLNACIQSIIVNTLHYLSFTFLKRRVKMVKKGKSIICMFSNTPNDFVYRNIVFLRLTNFYRYEITTFRCADLNNFNWLLSIR